MVEFRPHVLEWVTAGTPGGKDANGLPIADQPGSIIQTPCRFHQDSSKVYKNEDGTEVKQVGRIRLDAGISLPDVGIIVTVTDSKGNVQFKGPVRERYEAQMSGRLEV
jgi:hypothetical protein